MSNDPGLLNFPTPLAKFRGRQGVWNTPPGGAANVI